MSSARFVALVSAMLVGCVSTTLAAERMHGTVLSVDRTHSKLIVHHAPFGGMPSMTMEFRVDRAAANRVHAGDTIDASVDTKTEPWTLHDVHLHASGLPKQSPGPVSALRIGDPLPHVMLTDQLGRAIAFDEPRSVPTVLSFIYTRCRDATMCPLISSKFRLLQDSGVPMHLLELTLDPDYDRPPVLRRYGALFGADPARWTIATGDPATLRDLAERFGISAKTARTSPATIVHTDTLAIVDPKGRLVSLVDGSQWKTDEIIALVRAAADRSALARVRETIRSSLIPLCGAQTADAILSASMPAAIVLVSVVPVIVVLLWIVSLARRQRLAARSKR